MVIDGLVPRVKGLPPHIFLEETEGALVKFTVSLIKVRVVILFKIGFDASDLLKSLFMTRLRLGLLALQEKIFDKHAAQEKQQAHFSCGDEPHGLSICRKGFQVALKEEEPVEDLEFVEQHDLRGLLDELQDGKLEQEVPVVDISLKGICLFDSY